MLQVTVFGEHASGEQHALKEKLHRACLAIRLSLKRFKLIFKVIFNILFMRVLFCQKDQVMGNHHLFHHDWYMKDHLLHKQGCITWQMK